MLDGALASICAIVRKVRMTDWATGVWPIELSAAAKTRNAMMCFTLFEN